MATHFRSLAWRIPGIEQPCRLQSKVLDGRTGTHTHTRIYKGLQSSIQLRGWVCKLALDYFFTTAFKMRLNYRLSFKSDLASLFQSKSQSSSEFSHRHDLTCYLQSYAFMVSVYILGKCNQEWPLKCSSGFTQSGIRFDAHITANYIFIYNLFILNLWFRNSTHKCISL